MITGDGSENFNVSRTASTEKTTDTGLKNDVVPTLSIWQL
jgi:hypothetical protein